METNNKTQKNTIPPEEYEKSHGTTKEKTALFLLIVIPILLVILYILACNTYPGIFLPQCRENREAIIAYAEKNYPNATIVEEIYNSARFNPTGNPRDIIIFELDDIRFSILARHGIINPNCDDYYGAAHIEQEIRKNYLDYFMTECNLTLVPQIGGFMGGNPRADDTLETYSGRICIDFFVPFEEGKNHPRDLGWMYEFYTYWKQTYPYDNYSVYLLYDVTPNQCFYLYFYSDSNYEDEDSFYEAFIYNN